MSSPKLTEFDAPQSKIDLHVGDIMQFRFQRSDGLIIGLAPHDLDINDSGAMYIHCVVVDLLRPIPDRVKICTLTPKLLFEIGYLGSDLVDDEQLFLSVEPSSTTPADNGKTARTLSPRNPNTFFASDRLVDIKNTYEVSLTYLKAPNKETWDFCRFGKDSIDALLRGVGRARDHFVDGPMSAREEEEETGITMGSMTRREVTSETRSETSSETWSDTWEIPQPSNPSPPPKASQTPFLNTPRKRTGQIPEI